MIGIVAVTLMGAAIHGIDIGFEASLAMLGDDILYVEKWPWHNVEDWWKYVGRPPFRLEDADALNRIIRTTPDTLLDSAVPVAQRSPSTVRAGANAVNGVFTMGTLAGYVRMTTVDFDSGRFFSEDEADAGRPVCVLGRDVADALFSGRSAIGETVTIKGQPLRVVGVFARQGAFLGLFSFDSQIVMPFGVYRRLFDVRHGSVYLRVKARDKLHLAEAMEELIGAMRRVRGLPPGKRDDFSINQQEAFKQQLDPVRKSIAFAGLFITGLSLFVGAIGIMNITFVSVKERTREIGTRKALGARRRTILLQFLIEAVCISAVGGAIGLALTGALCLVIKATMPALPVEFSITLVFTALLASVATGIISGFVPAVGASRLDPVVALRYE